ncbi:MAG: hypothetical protein GX556_16045 [Fibrobacter sp.]|nr:hypothetical protein [Fibrobacter sp.]
MFVGQYEVLYKKTGVLLCRKLGVGEDLFCLMLSKHHAVRVGQVLRCRRGISKITSDLKKISSLAEKMQILVGGEVKIPFHLVRTRVKIKH